MRRILRATFKEGSGQDEHSAGTELATVAAGGVYIWYSVFKAAGDT